MKTNFILYLIFLLLLITSCSSCKPAEESVANIDVTKNYPEKVILLTDIANITYLHLHTDDDNYLYAGRIDYVTKNTVVVVDRSSSSILLFSKDGAPKSRFNHLGQGPGEYAIAPEVIYDETADEVFVHNNRRTVLVYSSSGEHKRTIQLAQEITRIESIIDFDDHSLFFFDFSIEDKGNGLLMEGANISVENHILPFYRISKTTGEVLDYVELSGNKLLLKMFYNERWHFVPRYFAVKCPEGVLLCNAQTDTIFLYSNNKSLSPVFFKAPSAKSQKQIEYLFLCLDRGLYQFIQVNLLTDGVAPIFLPAKYYLRNKKTGETVRPKFHLPDYKDKEFIMNQWRPNANGIAARDGVFTNDGYCFELDLFELKQACRDNKLNGKLKELVESLNEDEDNNVFMLVDFK